MILISSRLDDISTSNVIDWLYYQGKDYLRFNGDSFDALFSYRNNVLYFKSNYRDKEIPLKHIDSFWYRKCGLNIRKGNNSQANIDVLINQKIPIITSQLMGWNLLCLNIKRIETLSSLILHGIHTLILVVIDKEI